MRPDDETVQALNRAVEDQPIGDQYVWHTCQDDKVRSSHALREGKVFSWINPPEGGNPGEDHNCRCWATPTTATQKPSVTAKLFGQAQFRLNEIVIEKPKNASKKWSEEDFKNSSAMVRDARFRWQKRVIAIKLSKQPTRRCFLHSELNCLIRQKI